MQKTYKTHKTTSFHRLALAAAAALSMAGTAVVAAEANDVDMPWVSHLAVQPMQGVITWQERCDVDASDTTTGGEVSAGAVEMVKPSCDEAQAMSREEVRQEAVEAQRRNPDAGEGEAGDLRQRLEQRADITRDDDVAVQALRDASASADDPSTGAFVVDTDEGPMLLIVTDDADAPYTLVALQDAVILPATD